MIILHYPPIAWYHLVYGVPGDVIERTRREVEWTPEPGSPAVGLFQFLPSTFGHFTTPALDTSLHREASAALARGDRKAHRRALAELRDIERKH